MQPSYKDIRSQMLQALSKYNIKQVDVAREAGINHSTLSLWLQGSVKGNYINIQGDLAQWLDCLYSGRPRYTALGKAVNKQFNLVPGALEAEAKRAIQLRQELIPIHLEFQLDCKKYKESFCWNINDPYYTPQQFVKLLISQNSLLTPFQTQIVETIKKGINTYQRGRGGEPCLRILELDVKVDDLCLKDRFQWDVNDFGNSPEDFALALVEELNLNGQFAVKIAHQIRQQLLYYRKHPTTDPTPRPQSLMLDMKKSTRNLLALSNTYPGNPHQVIDENNYLRDGCGEDWQPKIQILDQGEIRRFIKFQERKNRYARRAR